MYGVLEWAGQAKAFGLFQNTRMEELSKITKT
jgi:hypothetical protein